MKWVILLLGISSNAFASVLIKLALTPPRAFPSLKHPLEVFSNWPLLLGLALYGAAFLFYALALSRLPLNVAHPILTSGAVAMVAVCSATIFHETFYWTTIVGIGFVLVGVVLIASRVA